MTDPSLKKVIFCTQIIDEKLTDNKVSVCEWEREREREKEREMWGKRER